MCVAKKHFYMSSDPAVERFVEFLKIKTVSGDGPAGSYQEASAWLVKQAEATGLVHQVYIEEK